MGLPGCLFVCHLILLLMCFLFNYNRQLIAELNHSRNVYKRTIQSKKRQFTSNIISELESLQYQSPKCFWDLAKCLNFNNKNNEQVSKNISVNDWLAHFKKLMARPNSEIYSDTFENEISNYISENSSLFNELNYSITSEEINRAMLLLKNNKSAGNDRILNEFLKTGKFFLLPYITMIFNMIYINGFYPSSWRLNTLTSVYKKG